MQAAGDTVVLGDPSKPNYTFAGWLFADQALTLTAQWNKNPLVRYTSSAEKNTEQTFDYNTSVHFHAGGSTFVNPEDTTTTIDSYTMTLQTWGQEITLPDLVWENHTFQYWNFNSQDNSFRAVWKEHPEVVYDAYTGDDSEFTNDVKQFFEAETNITFALDGGTGEYTLNGIENDITDITLGLDDNLVLGEPVKEGYAFAGWSLSGTIFTANWVQDAAVEFNKMESGAIESVTENLSRFTDDTIKLDLSFNAGEEVEYTVNGDTGTHGDSENHVVLELKGGENTLGDPEKAENTFAGWSYDASNRLFTANWKNNALLHYFDYETQQHADINEIAVGKTVELLGLEDGTCKVDGNSVTQLSMTEGEKYDLHNADITRDGYAFTGWTYDETYLTLTAHWIENAEVTYQSSSTSNETVELTRYPVDNFKLNFGLTDGEVATYEEEYTAATTVEFSLYLDDESKMSLQVPAKQKVETGGFIQHFTFQNWDFEEVGRTFTARWQKNTKIQYLGTDGKYGAFTDVPVGGVLKIDKNYGGGDSDITNYTVTGEKALLTIGAPEALDGKAFGGWEYDKENLCLTATWKQKPVVTYQSGSGDIEEAIFNIGTEVVFDTNGGVLDGAPAKKTLAEAETFKLSAPVYSGYTFLYWTVNGNVFTAQWKENPRITYKKAADGLSMMPSAHTDNDMNIGAKYTLVYDNGKNPEERQIPDEAMAALEVTDPAREGYVFMGWVREDQAGEYTFTAQWEEDSIDVKNQTETGGDGIPDTFQGKITFCIQGGKWEDGKTDDVVKYVTLQNGTTPHINGSATVTLPKPGDALPGYSKDGAGWDGGLTGTEVVIAYNTAKTSYTYSFVAKDPVKITYLSTARDDAHELISKEIEVAYNSKILKIDGSRETLTITEAVVFTNPTAQSGKIFMGWNVQPAVDGVHQYTMEAIWSEDENDNDIPDEYEVTVTFHVVGGKWADGTTDLKKVVASYEIWNESGEATVTIPTGMTPNPGYNDTGTWSDGLTGETVTVREDKEFTFTFSIDNPYITYKEAAADLDTMPSEQRVNDMNIGVKYTLVYDENTKEEKEILPNTSIIEDPQKDGYAFLGWVRNGYTFTAQWAEDSINVNNQTETGGDGIPDTFQRKVTFCVQGGTWEDGKTDAVVKYVTLLKDDVPHKEGTATATLPNPGDAMLGYSKDGAGWNGGLTGTEVVIEGASGENTYTYSFLKAGNVNITYSSAERNNKNELVEKSISAEGVDLNSKILKITGDGNEETLTIAQAGKIADATAPKGKVFMGWNVQPAEDGVHQYTMEAIWSEDANGNNIPDEYEVTVTFRVVGGKWADGETAKKIPAAYTIWSKSSAATVTIPTDMKPDSGRSTTGTWSGDLGGKNTVDVKEDKEFTFTFPIQNSLGGSSSGSSSSGSFSSSGSSSNDEAVKQKDEPNTKEEVKQEEKVATADESVVKFITPEVLKEEHVSYVSGYEDQTIRPNAPITRAEVATMLFNLLKDEQKEKYYTEQSDFVDVNHEVWYSAPIATLVNMKLLSGYEGGAFKPDQYITRAEMAAILARLEYKGELGAAVEFVDIENSWANAQIQLVAQRGWISGYPDGSFNPDAKITRAETIAMINRMMGRNPQSVDVLHEDAKQWKDNQDPDKWYYIHIQEATSTHKHARDENGFEIKMID